MANKKGPSFIGFSGDYTVGNMQESIFPNEENIQKKLDDLKFTVMDNCEVNVAKRVVGYTDSAIKMLHDTRRSIDDKLIDVLRSVSDISKEIKGKENYQKKLNGIVLDILKTAKKLSSTSTQKALVNIASRIKK
jgi:hypothetical protein